MISADFRSQKLESFDILNQSIEVEIFQVQARRRRAARCVGVSVQRVGLLASFRTTPKQS